MSELDTQLKKFAIYIEELNDIKEVINSEIPELRYNGIDGTTALISFERNMQKLQAIRTEVQQTYTSELNEIHFKSISIMKIINNLENANLLYHDFAEEKLRTGTNNMEVYNQIIDCLIETFQSLNAEWSSIKEIIHT